jgi:hypothetical protein
MSRKIPYDQEYEMLFEILKNSPTVGGGGASPGGSPGGGNGSPNNSSTDKSGYYPGITINTCGVKTIDHQQIQIFNSYKGRFSKNRNFSPQDINTLVGNIKNSITGDTKGLCSRGIINASYLLDTSIKLKSKKIIWGKRKKEKGNQVSGGGIAGLSKADANNKLLHDNYFVSQLGYSKHIIAQNLPFSSTRDTINKLNWETGDICVYWSNSPGSSLGKWQYGHIQMYHQGKWFSDFKHSEFVYSSGECWTIIAFKAS